MFCVAHTLGLCCYRDFDPQLYLTHVCRLVRQEHDSTRLLVLLGMYYPLSSHQPRSWPVLTFAAQILSVAFELAEYSLAHQLANFGEVRLFPIYYG